MILGISGRKQSGKNTTANILHGIILKKQGFINDWKIANGGQLLINTVDDPDSYGEFWVERKDDKFVTWADNNMWPYVKLYSFADNLKAICMDLFDIPFRCLYGTDGEKNQLQEHLLWENMPDVITDKDFYDAAMNNQYGAGVKNHISKITYHESSPMTAREFMQFLGTDVMRKIYEPIWVKSCIDKIKREQSELAIIADVRFPNEAKAIEDAGGIVLRLTRDILHDDHSSEIALDDYPFKHVINNKDINIVELIDKVKKFYKQIQHPFI